MDKIVYYRILDGLSSEDSISVSVRITVRNFPVEEVLEYHNEGKWSEDFNSISRVYNDSVVQDQWDNFRSRMLSFLDDDNMRIIMDIMAADDSFYSGSYDLEVTVNSYEILD